MAEDRNSYKNITKAIGLFGGVQVFHILAGIIKNKVVAVLLGPVGMGISGILLSTTSMISSATGLGLHTSAVRDVAKAYSSKDEEEVGTIVTVLRKLIKVTGLIGMLLTILISPLLSLWSFGNYDYTWAFVFVSVIVLFDQLKSGQTVLLQGTFHYRYMANASVIGSLVGLVIAIPLYYIWKMDAIVPVIILTSLSGLIVSSLFARKVQFQRVQLTNMEVWSIGKVMIVLGASIAVAGFANTGHTYLVRAVISNLGSIADVGLYTAGIGIATQYINVILQSMGSDYSPRIAALQDDREGFIEAVNRQTRLMIIIVIPFIIPFVVFIRELTILLYSTKFLAITSMIEWIMVGMFFRTTSWCLSFTIVAMGKPKQFLFNELATHVYSIAFTILGYILGSFTGMGIAFCVVNLVYTIQLFFVCRRLFKFRYFPETVRTVLTQFVIMMISVLIVMSLGYGMLRYVIGGVLVIAAWGLSAIQLNKILPLKSVVEAVKNKINRR
jgi:O-antigen/teichoic acid export membrane protein